MDVGTHDGFWAFEMERRGAADVVSIDVLDATQYDYAWPKPELSAQTHASNAERLAGFEVAREALDSNVRRLDLSVYDLSADAVGKFDFVVIGTLLLHLRDPALALHCVSRVLDGELLVNDAISLTLSWLMPRVPVAKFAGLPGLPYWWNLNVVGLRRLVECAGYEVLKHGGPYLVANGPGFVMPGRGDPIRPRFVRRQLLRRGLPHAWVLARPVRDPHRA